MPATRAPLPPPAGQAGYVLVEAIAALALIGLLITLALPLAPARTGAPQFDATVAAATALLRDARSEALGSGKAVAARFDARARRLLTATRQVQIPPDLDASALAAGTCPSDGTNTVLIVFRPDGTSCGAVLRFARGSRVVRLRVDWVDGRIAAMAGGE